MKQSFELVSERDISEMDSVTYEKICINISVALLESLYEDRHISDDAIKKSGERHTKWLMLCRRYVNISMGTKTG